MRPSIPLVAVAHGSRDPRSAQTIHAMTDVVRALRPELDVRTAFLGLSAPRLSDVLSAVHGDGHREAVVVPLLLGRAFHASVDVPAAVADLHRRHPRLHVHVADVLGPDHRIEHAARRRLAAAGARADDPRLGVVLAAAGSSHDPANRLVGDVVARWQARACWTGAVAAFAAAAEPDVATAMATLQARGARRVAVGLWFLAPGLLPDGVLRAARSAACAADGAIVAAPLGADRGVAEVVLDRYDAALAAAQPRLARAL